MISKDTLPQLLTQSGFKKQGEIFGKTIDSSTFKIALITAAPAKKQDIMQRYL